jgi:DNA processing protein
MADHADALELALTPDVSPRLIRALLTRAARPEILAHPRAHADLFSPRAIEAIASGKSRKRAEQEQDAARRHGYEIVSLDEPSFPALLRETYDPPSLLYVWGTLEPDDSRRGVAVVGSRAASPQGRALARAMGRDLAAAGVTVVSGLARGIDAAAHQGALDAGGRTVAVLGSGLDNVYPWENADLATAVARGGAVVSELALGTPPWRANFPRRNRIIAGWGPAVVVVEASDKSGALITARLALDEGREVFAVPGHPAQESATGTNQLIRDGAALVRGAEDVLSELGIEPNRRETPGPGTPGLLRHLRRDAPSSLEELQSRSGWPAAAVLSQLTELELSSQVRRITGSLYVRN